MKKIKLMLVAIAVLGVAGGTAAFKAKRFGGSSYCTTTLGGGDICCSFTRSASFIAGQQVQYVITNNPEACAIAWPECTSIGIRVN